MTNEQAIEMMKAKLECMTRDVSGTDQMCNAKKCDDCDLCYAQGNMGEQKEWLRMGIKALENQKTGHWTADVDKWGDVVTTINGYKCSECGMFNTDKDNFCPHCGAKMKGETE